MEKLISRIYEFYKKEKMLCIILFLMFLCIRIGYSIYLFELKYVTDDTNKKMYVEVIEKQEENDDKSSYLVKFENNKFIMNIYDSNEDYNVYDVLQIRGKIIIPKCLNNPYEFNYKRYLNSQNIVGTISVYSVKKIGVNDKIDFNILNGFKKKLLYKADKILYGNEKALFYSIICGEKDYNNTSVSKYFRDSGSSHFLAISGTHIMYYIYIIEIFIKNLDEKLKKYIKIILIILFNFMIGFQIALVRASIMYVINSIEIKGIRKNKFIRLIISAIIIIAYNPYSIFNSSFVFSFLAIIGIEVLLPLINSYFGILVLRLFGLKCMNDKFLSFSNLNKILFFIMQYILKNISFALSIQIITLPFQMYFFCEVNFISILSNIFLTPIIAFEFIIGFLTFFLVYIPYISDTILLANKTILTFIMVIVKNLSDIHILKLSVIKPDFISIIFYYVILSIFLFSKYLYRFLETYKVKKMKRIFKLVTLFLIFYIISVYVKVCFFEEYVYFFNVEQGNMALLHKLTTNIVVDIGSTSDGVASNILINFLKAKNISKIDMLIITHMHDDHINGVKEVMENVKISKVLLSNFENKGETKNSEFERMVKEKGISVINIAKGDNILFKNFEIDILSPPKYKVIESDDILNSNSLAFIISKGDYNYLFLGDATKETEEYMFKEKIYKDEIYDKLKKINAVQIGHHGSNTSTSELLLENINSCVAIISSKKKKFGHPSKETLELLNKYNFKMRITENEGAIKVK